MQSKKDHCGELLKQINDMTCRHANNALRSQGLTLSQLTVLIELESAPDRTLSFPELGRKLLVAQSTTFGLVKRLSEKGLTETFEDSRDGRIRLVRMTEAGQNYIDASEDKRIEMETILLSALTAEEQTQFLNLLTKVRDALKNSDLS